MPSGAEVRSGLRPQLLLEALIAANGGFPDVPAAVPAELLYWGLKGASDAAGEERDPVGEAITVEGLVNQAEAWLDRLLAHFDDPETAYLPVPRPEIAPTYSDYEHLARIAEWRDAEGEA